MLSRTLAEKRNRVLRDDTDRAPQRPPCDVPDVDTVDEDAALGRVVETRHQRGKCGLAGARGADQRDRAARGDLEIDAGEHGPRRVVAEADTLEDDAAGTGRQLARVLCVGHLLRLVDHLEEALARSGRALRLTDPHAEHAQRHHEHHQQEVEGEEAADRELALDDVVPGREEHPRLREHRQEGEQRHVERALGVRAHGRAEDAVGGDRGIAPRPAPPARTTSRCGRPRSTPLPPSPRRRASAARRAGRGARRGCSGRRRRSAAA